MWFLNTGLGFRAMQLQQADAVLQRKHVCGEGLLKCLLGSILLAFTFSSYAREMTVTVTAYCACQKCCSEKATGITASGKVPREGITVAGPRRIKFGTRVQIEGVGERLVQDRLAKRYDNRFDVYFSDHEEAVRFGKRRLKVKIVPIRPAVEAVSQNGVGKKKEGET